MLINSVKNNWLIFFIFTVFFIKIFFYLLIKNEFLVISLGGGSDANLYNAHALGYTNVEVNIWPVILRYLNDLGLYSRDGITVILLVLNLFFIPILTANLSGLRFNINQKYYLCILLLCLIYPTLYFYTFDIYRDVFMVFSFLMGCFFVKKIFLSNRLIPFLCFYFLAILSGFFLMALRPYLGYAFIIALILWKIKLTKKSIILFGFLYVLALYTANYIGLLNKLTEYRSGFEESEAGSNLGLDFSNHIMFIPNLILSILGQLFGLYVSNPFAIILLLIESVPFIFMLVYIVRNIRLADNFIRFLIIFFIFYASVWLIGNDNLGTAVRLRMYNYLAIYICFFYILRVKYLSLVKPEVINK